MHYATPIEVRNECAAQMASGVCLTLQPSQSPLIVAGIGAVSPNALNDYISKINPANLSDPAMCNYALAKMTEQPGSDYEVTARVLWTPPDAFRQPDYAPAIGFSVGATLLMCAALALLGWPALNAQLTAMTAAKFTLFRPFNGTAQAANLAPKMASAILTAWGVWWRFVWRVDDALHR